MIAHINIGSNLGDRTAHIARAVSLLDPLVGKVTAVSTPVESDAWGYQSTHSFINIGVNIETSLTPEEIVERLQKIEQIIAPGETHRTEQGTYADRTIDLDLICLGDTINRNPAARVPHPRMLQRSFVIGPLAEILPDWIHPEVGQTNRKVRT